MKEHNISPFNPMRILCSYREIRQILDGDMPIPRVVEIFPSGLCNHSCIGCLTNFPNNSENIYLDVQKTKKLFRELRSIGVSSIVFSGGGEPLTHPGTLDLIAYGKKKGFTIGLITNGTLIDRTRIEDILENLFFIRIAYDACTPETYKKIHGVDDFQLVIDNIKRLLSHRKEGKFKTTIGLKYLVSKINQREILDAASQAKKLGVDYIQFKALRNSKYEISKKQEESISRLIEKSGKLSDKNFNVFGSVKKTGIEDRCILNPLHPVVWYSGDVYMCAFFHHRNKTHRIGNIYGNSFRDIWYGRVHYERFNKTDVKECNIYDCPFHDSNSIVKGAIIDGKMHLEFI